MDSTGAGSPQRDEQDGVRTRKAAGIPPEAGKSQLFPRAAGN